MRLYEITAAEVDKTLGSPDQMTPGALGREHAWRQQGPGRWLRVTFVDEADRRVVITVTPKRAFRGGPDAH